MPRNFAFSAAEVHSCDAKLSLFQTKTERASFKMLHVLLNEKLSCGLGVFRVQIRAR